MSSYADIQGVLADQAEFLLDHTCETIPKEQLHPGLVPEGDPGKVPGRQLVGELLDAVSPPVERIVHEVEIRAAEIPVEHLHLVDHVLGVS